MIGPVLGWKRCLLVGLVFIFICPREGWAEVSEDSKSVPSLPGLPTRGSYTMSPEEEEVLRIMLGRLKEVDPELKRSISELQGDLVVSSDSEEGLGRGFHQKLARRLQILQQVAKDGTFTDLRLLEMDYRKLNRIAEGLDFFDEESLYKIIDYLGQSFKKLAQQVIRIEQEEIVDTNKRVRHEVKAQKERRSYLLVATFQCIFLNLLFVGIMNPIIDYLVLLPTTSSAEKILFSAISSYMPLFNVFFLLPFVVDWKIIRDVKKLKSFPRMRERNSNPLDPFLRELYLATAELRRGIFPCSKAIESPNEK